MSASFFGRRFIVPAFPAPPPPFAVLPSGLAGVDYSVRRFPDSSVPGCCPSRCRFPYRFRYRCSGASPALPMPSRMSCALGTWLLLPGCDPACLSVLWVPGAGCPPLACLLSGGAPLAVVFRSCRTMRFPRRRALGSGGIRCRFPRHRSLCARLFLFLRPAVLAVFLRGVLELLDAASQAAHQFGDFPAAEQEQYDQQDKYQLGRAEEQGDDE